MALASLAHSTVPPALRPQKGFWLFPVLLAFLLEHYPDVPPYAAPRTENVALEYDFIVVGGGSAGSVVASRLSEDPRMRVLLLEAGREENAISDVPALASYLQEGIMDWRYRTQPQTTACLAMKNQSCKWPRGKVLGGSSVLNFMLYVRGNRRDYDLWQSEGNVGWSFDDVLPYFLKSEDNRNPYVARNGRFHSVGGPLTIDEPRWKSPLALSFLEGGVAMGYSIVDINSARQTGFTLPQGTLRDGKRCSSSKAFLRQASWRPNLDIAVSALVRKVIFTDGRRAYGVEFEKDGRVQRTYARKEIVLSAGAINTPQLLMLSGIGPREHLKKLKIPVVKDADVGRNLQDHIGAAGLFFLVNKEVSLVARRYENVKTMSHFLKKRSGPLTVMGGVEGLAFLNTRYSNASLDFPDVEFHFIPSSSATDGGRFIRRIQGLTEETWNKFLSPISEMDCWTAVPTLLRPRSRGYMELQDANPHHHPLIFPNYLTHPDDLKVLVEGLKLVLALSRAPSFRKYGSRLYKTPFPGCERFSFLSDGYLECLSRHYTVSIYHPCCTAKMGPAWDKTAVVDPQLRVRGVTGLRVADGSVMPHIVSGNTNAPIIMIGEKAADLVKKTWKLE